MTTDFKQAHDTFEQCELYQVTFENLDNQETTQMVYIDLLREDGLDSDFLNECVENLNFSIQEKKKILDPAWLYLVEFEPINEQPDKDLIVSFHEMTFDELQQRHPDRVIEHVEIFKNRFHESA